MSRGVLERKTMNVSTLLYCSVFMFVNTAPTNATTTRKKALTCRKGCFHQHWNYDCHVAGPAGFRRRAGGREELDEKGAAPETKGSYLSPLQRGALHSSKGRSQEHGNSRTRQLTQQHKGWCWDIGHSNLRGRGRSREDGSAGRQFLKPPPGFNTACESLGRGGGGCTLIRAKLWQTSQRSRSHPQSHGFKSRLP